MKKKISKLLSQDGLFKIFTIIVVVFIALICLIPFLHIAAVSFSNKTPVIKGEIFLLPKQIDLSAYKAVFNNKSLMDSMWFTIFLTVVSTLFSLTRTGWMRLAMNCRQMKMESII